MDQIYEGRRKYPRVAVDAVMMIKAANGVSRQSNINNISIDGAQVNCDKETARAILPAGSKSEDKQQPEVDAAFELEVDGKHHKLEIPCKIYYIVSLDKTNVSIGLLFDRVADGHREIIEQFIAATV